MVISRVDYKTGDDYGNTTTRLLKRKLHSKYSSSPSLLIWLSTGDVRQCLHRNRTEHSLKGDPHMRSFLLARKIGRDMADPAMLLTATGLVIEPFYQV